MHKSFLISLETTMIIQSSTQHPHFHDLGPTVSDLHDRNLRELARIARERESLIRDRSVFHAAELSAVAASNLPAALAALEAGRIPLERGPLESAVRLIRESSVLSTAQDRFALGSELARKVSSSTSALFDGPAHEIAAAALTSIQRLSGESAQAAAAASLPAVSQMYGGTVRNIVAASLPSLEMASALAAASFVVQSELREYYQPLAQTALATAEIQALLSSISHTEACPDWLLPLTSSLSHLAGASTGIWGVVAQHPTTSGPPLTGWLLEAPIIQTYDASRSIVQLASLEDEEDFPEPITQFRVEADVVGARLEKFGKRFLIPYRAAHDALASRREDYTRQATTSLRELLDKLLDHLAPDSHVKTWPESATLLKKEPRKAQLKFLFRHIVGGAYYDFVEKDIDLILQTFYALNKGVHSLENPYTDRELRLLVARVDGHLLMLFEAAEIERAYRTSDNDSSK